MEQELGIGELSQNEKDVLYAVQVAYNMGNGVARSDDIRNHMLREVNDAADLPPQFEIIGSKRLLGPRAEHQSGLVYSEGNGRTDSLIFSG